MREALEHLGFVFHPSKYGEGEAITHPKYPEWELMEWECKYLKTPFDVIVHLMDWQRDQYE
jgi:hypothetical protein